VKVSEAVAEAVWVEAVAEVDLVAVVEVVDAVEDLVGVVVWEADAAGLVEVAAEYSTGVAVSTVDEDPSLAAVMSLSVEAIHGGVGIGQVGTVMIGTHALKILRVLTTVATIAKTVKNQTQYVMML
jgi:hypothetical protein